MLNIYNKVINKDTATPEAFYYNSLRNIRHFSTEQYEQLPSFCVIFVFVHICVLQKQTQKHQQSLARVSSFLIFAA